MAAASADRRWVAAYPAGVPADIAVPTVPLTTLLDQAVRRYGSRTALDFMGATTSYRELGDQVARAAEALRRVGIGPGDRVALVLPNCPQHVVAFYAVLRLRAIVVEHNPLYTQDELARQFEDHGARAVICWEKVARTVAAISVGTPLMIIAIDLTAAFPWSKRLALALPVRKARNLRAQMRDTRPPGVLSWERLVASAPPLDPRTPGPAVEDVALLQYTGGTTGAPKGAILTHRNLAANAAQGRAWVPGLREGKETIFAVLPFFHAYGLTLCLTFAIQIGACLVLFPRFDVDQFLAAARRRPPTFLPGVPPMFDRIAAAARERGADLTSVRYAISGAMALAPAIVRQWEEVTGGILVEGYGMTETSPVALGNPMSAELRRTGTVGVPFPSTRVRIADSARPSVDRPRGQPGEVLIQGPQVFSGYWHRPQETKATLLPDGWIRTGDVGVMDDDGFVTIVDRIKELIITGGFNVYPSEVEDVLRRHPDVADAAVVGIPGATEGEEVVAAVVPAEGTTFDPEAVRVWCRENIAGYKAPRRIIAVAELPRTEIGKVPRRQVRESIMNLS
jgi:long-chain acyl-CoA synthetase